MLDKSFSLLFYLKKRNDYVKGKLPIYMRITVDGARNEITTKRKCEPERWNSETGRAIGNKEEVKSLNQYLDVLQSKVYEARRNLIENNQLITSEWLKNTLIGRDERPRMLIEIFQHHNDQMKTLVGKEFSKATAIRYNTSIRHTKAFLKWKFIITDIDIKKLNFEFISDYEFWLKSIRKCNQNSTLKYLSNFRKDKTTLKSG
jgi:hypothetical protein